MMSAIEQTVSKAVSGGPDAKELQMQMHTINNNDKHARSTTDHGLPVSNLDNWLAVANENRVGETLKTLHAL